MRSTRLGMATGLSLAALLWPAGSASAQQAAAKPLTVASPNGTIVVSVTAGSDLRWSVDVGGKPVLLPSSIGLTLDGGRAVGARPRCARRPPGPWTRSCAPSCESSAPRCATASTSGASTSSATTPSSSGSMTTGWRTGSRRRWRATSRCGPRTPRSGSPAIIGCTSRRRPASCRTRSGRTSGFGLARSAPGSRRCRPSSRPTGRRSRLRKRTSSIIPGWT